MLDSELDEMKKVNIADYAVSKGYALNKVRTSKNALCYENSTGDRIVVGTDSKSGHSIYFSVRDDHDNGTIVDFIQKREGLNLGQVRRELRPWIGRGPEPRTGEKQPVAPPTTKDRAEQARGLAACELATDRHPYLESRGIEARTLNHFKGMVYTDQRGNAIFPHYDAQGVAGLEIKNDGFTGFSKGGEKGLWLHGRAGCKKIVCCESAIDCMSHYQIKGEKDTMYISTAGRMNEDAKDNLRRLIEMNPQAEVVAAFDNDEAGKRYAQELAEIAQKQVKGDLPEQKDWNDQLRHDQEQEKHSFGRAAMVMRPGRGRDDEEYER